MARIRKLKKRGRGTIGSQSDRMFPEPTYAFIESESESDSEIAYQERKRARKEAKSERRRQKKEKRKRKKGKEKWGIYSLYMHHWFSLRPDSHGVRD